MLFMGYPIDVLWLDSGRTVVDVFFGAPPVHVFKPATWRVYRPKKPAKYVIELGKGSIGRTEPGDLIDFI